MKGQRGRSGESWGSGSLFFLRIKESHGKSSAQKCIMHKILSLRGRESSQLLNNHEHYNNHCNVKRKNRWLSLRKYQVEDSDFLVFLINAQRRIKTKVTCSSNGWLTLVHSGHALTKDKHKLHPLEHFQLCYLNRAIKEKGHVVSYNSQNLDSLIGASRPLHFSTFLIEGTLNLCKKIKLRDHLVLTVPK